MLYFLQNNFFGRGGGKCNPKVNYVSQLVAESLSHSMVPLKMKNMTFLQLLVFCAQFCGVNTFINKLHSITILQSYFVIIFKASTPNDKQGHAMIIKQLWSKCRLIIVFPKRVKIEIQIFIGIESPDQTYNHTCISFSSIEDSRSN